MEIQKIIVDFERFFPLYAGNDFVFNLSDLLDFLADGSTSETPHLNGFLPPSLLSSTKISRSASLQSQSSLIREPYSGSQYPCYPLRRSGGFGPFQLRYLYDDGSFAPLDDPNGRLRAIAPAPGDFSEFQSRLLQQNPGFSLLVFRPYTVGAYVEGGFDNVGVFVPAQFLVIDSGEWVLIESNPAFQFTFSNTSFQREANVTYFIYPEFQIFTQDRVSGSTEYAGIQITPCEDFAASNGTIARFTSLVTGQSTAQVGQRLIPVLVNVEGDKILTQSHLGSQDGSPQVDLSRFTLRKIGQSEDIFLSEITVDSEDALSQYFRTHQADGKPTFLSFVGETIYIALEEYHQLFNEQKVGDRPYFRSDSSLILDVVGAQPRQEPVQSLQIPEDFAYNVDFRVDDLSVFL